MKEQILKLRGEGKTYTQISNILNCSKGTISYHCGEGQKQKTARRRAKRAKLKNEYQNTTRKILREFSWRYRKLVGCIDCGIKDPRVLEYDHIDRTKKFLSVSKLVHQGYSIDLLKKEIRKCKVRCANCHRIKTHNNSETLKLK